MHNHSFFVNKFLNKTSVVWICAETLNFGQFAEKYYVCLRIYVLRAEFFALHTEVRKKIAQKLRKFSAKNMVKFRENHPLLASSVL